MSKIKFIDAWFLDADTKRRAMRRFLGRFLVDIRVWSDTLTVVHQSRPLHVCGLPCSSAVPRLSQPKEIFWKRMLHADPAPDLVAAVDCGGPENRLNRIKDFQALNGSN